MTNETPTCGPDHPHDRTVNCYRNHGCRCFPCKLRASRDDAEYRAKKAAGFEGFMPIGPVQAHVLTLIEAGTSIADICARSGVSHPTLTIIRHARQDRVFSTTARAVLAVRPMESATNGGSIDGRGTYRRLGALIALGYTTHELADASGIHWKTIGDILRGSRVMPETRDAVAATYDRLSMIVPPNERGVYRGQARAWAKRRGWALPLAWDDIDNDPEPATAESDPGETRGVRVLENAEWLLNAGETPEIIVGTLGRTAGSLAKLARFHNRPDIATHFYALDKHERTAA